MSKINTLPENRELCNLYQNGENTVTLAKKFGVTPRTINLRLKKTGIVLKPKLKDYHRKYKVNRYYFNNIDSEDKAYWLGFIFGDGGISNGTLRVEIKKQDKKHLVKFLESLQSNHPIKPTKKNTYYVAISNTDLVKDLSKFYIVPNKTYITNKLPLDLIPVELQKHFIRGYFDADGNINISKTNYLTCSFACYHESILQQLSKFLDNFQINEPYFYHRIKRNQSCWSLAYNTKENSFKLASYLFNEANIYLERKYHKFLKFASVI